MSMKRVTVSIEVNVNLRTIKLAATNKATNTIEAQDIHQSNFQFYFLMTILWTKNMKYYI